MTIPALKRINELARKHKSVGLNDAELAEREVLRKEYLQAIRGNVESHLLVATIIDPEGTDVTPFKLRAAKAARRNKLQ